MCYCVRTANLKNELESQRRHLCDVENHLKDIDNELKENKTALDSAQRTLTTQIQDTDLRAEQRNAKTMQATNSKAMTGLVIAVVLASLLGIAWWLLHRRIKRSKTGINELKAKADALNEEIVGKLSLQMNEMQGIASAIKNIPKDSGEKSSDNQHDLIKALADRITFMEMTLYKMDKSVRGYKQLSRSIAQMKDNLLANGYEIVDMLGKDYHEGMKVVANFIEDEELPLGKQVITGITKPQINYQGKMIQAAQINVSQNIE